MEDVNKGSEAIEFSMVTETYDPASHPKRGLAAFQVEKSGRSVSNVEAAEAFLKFLEEHYGKTIDPYRCYLEFGANPKKGMVALYASDTQTEGGAAIRWSDDRKTFLFHLGAVLRKYPQLKPSTTVEAPFVATKDQNERPCLAIKLRGAIPKRKGPVDPEEAARKKEERMQRKLLRQSAAAAARAAQEKK